MNPGELRERITISRPKTGGDGMGGETRTLEKLCDCWAKVTATRSRSGIISGRDLELRTHEVTIRLGRVEPENGDVITWRGKTLTVRAVRPDYAHAGCEMDCRMEA